MKKKEIGILGCGGYIGKYVTEKLLRLGFCVRGAQRREIQNVETNSNFSFVSFDVKDKKKLDTFIQTCDVIVNCISPSHLYGKIVKDAVCKQNKIYIDPSDMIFENDKERRSEKIVASCGYIPGMSEFLPYIVSKQYFDEIDRGIIYQGGFDGCSAGAFVDMILGAGNKNLYGDTYILDGKITPLSVSLNIKQKTPFTQEKVIFKPLINRDSIRLQRKMNSKEHYFFCTYDNKETLCFFMRLLMEVTKYDKTTAANNIKRRLYERIKNDETFGKDTVGAYLFFELLGKKSNKEKVIVGKVFLKNVNRLCGNFLGEIVKEIVMNPHKIAVGFNYGFEIPDESYSKKMLSELEDGEYVKISEIPIQEKIDINNFIRRKGE